MSNTFKATGRETLVDVATKINENKRKILNSELGIIEREAKKITKPKKHKKENEV